MAHESPYSPSLLRRMQQVTHKLTIDLFLRSGVFWDEVRQVRSLWGLLESVPCQVPPPLYHLTQPWDGTCHHPPTPEHLDDSFDAAVGRWDALHNFCCRWHDRFGGNDGQFSYVFLSGCVCFDPPADNLIGFANHADTILGNWHPRLPDGEVPPPGLPIAWIPDLDLLTQEASSGTQYYERLHFRQLKEHLLRSLHNHGLDGNRLWVEAESSTRMAQAHLRARWPLPSEEPLPDPDGDMQVWLESQPMIVVSTDTSDADIRAAVRWIRARLPEGERPSKRPRDPLVSVQCAILRDDLDWSEKEIGDHFDWTIQYPHDAKPRCETARKHIVEGRALRQHTS